MLMYLREGTDTGWVLRENWALFSLESKSFVMITKEIMVWRKHSELPGVRISASSYGHYTLKLTDRDI